MVGYKKNYTMPSNPVCAMRYVRECAPIDGLTRRMIGKKAEAASLVVNESPKVNELPQWKPIQENIPKTGDQGKLAEIAREKRTAAPSVASLVGTRIRSMIVIGLLDCYPTYDDKHKFSRMRVRWILRCCCCGHLQHETDGKVAKDPQSVKCNGCLGRAVA